MRTLLVGLAVLLMAGSAWAGTTAVYWTPSEVGRIDYPSPYTTSADAAVVKHLLYCYQTTNGSSIMNQTGGTITNSDRVTLGYLEYAGSVLALNISGGSMTNGGDTDLGSYNTPNKGSFTLNVSGTGSYTGSGTARIGDGLDLTEGTATVAVSGSGSLALNNYVQFGNGNSFFKVTGGLATISLNHMWFGQSDGTGVYAVGGLDFTLDSNGTNISPINTSNNVDLSNAGNAGVIDMALLGFTPAQNQVFDLIIAPTGKTIFLPVGGAMTLLDAGDWGTWSLAVVTGSSQHLQATYLLPEPATLALLGFGGVSLLLRRRRQQ